jgi:hypothetical protein
MMNNIVKGSIVNYDNRWMRVTAVYSKTVNLGPVWGGRNGFSGIICKVPKNEVYEDGEAWYRTWTKSETYQCM